jgi:CubicO group peptidase (beta-lactamase class C family)
MRKFFIAIALLATTTIGLCQSNPFTSKLPLIDKYIDSFMKEWNIPGLAIGIVYKDQLIYARGFGYRDVENKLPVDSKTIFPIASNSKLFTSTAACMLAIEGKLNLDKPVRNYMPSLSFNNDELNAKVTLRDMLSHRTGLPRYDGIWVASPYTRKETIDKVVYMKPQLGFREGYIYNNMMFASVGAVMENVTGSSWEEIIKSRIFQPLQMNASCFTNEDMMRQGNFAYPYFEADSTSPLHRLTFFAQSAALGPAGIIKSNIEDMSHWMMAQLNDGTYKGEKAIPEAAIKQTLIPNNIGDKESKYEELSNPLYCLGRIIQTYKGFKIYTHTGSIDGIYSNLSFVPGKNIAVFMVHNSVPAGSVRPIMAFPVIDRLLGLDQTRWSERYKKDYLAEKASSKKAKDSINATQVKNTHPSHALEAYTGKYSNPVYGDILINLEKEQLTLSFRTIQSVLHHFHYDYFYTDEETTGKPSFRLNFTTNNKGEINSISMQPFGDPVAEFVKVTK